MFDPLLLYRLYSVLWRHHIPLVPAALHFLNRLITGCDLHPSVEVGGDVVFRHWGPGVVVGPSTVVGNNVVFFPGCRALTVPSALARCRIRIGDRVQIGVGAVILADRDLDIGDAVQIGAGALVRKSVPPHTTATGCDDIALRLRCQKPPSPLYRRSVISPRALHAISRWFHLRNIPWVPGFFFRLNYLLNRCILGPGSRIGRQARVGRWVLLSFANVGDRAIVHDGVIAARNVRNGRATQADFVEIERAAEIGRGAIIVGADEMRIGEGACIEEGAVVTHSVPPGCTVAGVPARIVARPSDPGAE